MFVAALFTIANIWKQSVSTDKLMDKRCDIYHIYTIRWWMLTRVIMESNHFTITMYINIKSSCCIPETNIMLCVNYTSIKN